MASAFSAIQTNTMSMDYGQWPWLWALFLNSQPLISYHFGGVRYAQEWPCEEQIKVIRRNKKDRTERRKKNHMDSARATLNKVF